MPWSWPSVKMSHPTRGVSQILGYRRACPDSSATRNVHDRGRVHHVLRHLLSLAHADPSRCYRRLQVVHGRYTRVLPYHRRHDRGRRGSEHLHRKSIKSAKRLTLTSLSRIQISAARPSSITCFGFILARLGTRTRPCSGCILRRTGAIGRWQHWRPATSVALPLASCAW